MGEPDDFAARAPGKARSSGMGRLSADNSPESLQTVAIVEIGAAEELKPVPPFVTALQPNKRQAQGQDQ